MLIKVLMVSVLLYGCGNDIKIKNNKLESAEPLSDSQLSALQKSGTLTVGSPSRIQFQGQQLTVSEYSSKVTQDFISSFPSGTQVPVYFIGEKYQTTMVIETIKRQ